LNLKIIYYFSLADHYPTDVSGRNRNDTEISMALELYISPNISKRLAFVFSNIVQVDLKHASSIRESKCGTPFLLTSGLYHSTLLKSVTKSTFFRTINERKFLVAQTGQKFNPTQMLKA